MTDRVYTIGYSGRKPEEIKQLLKDHGAVLFDIRFSPRSRVPYWNAGPFRQLLGDSYRHVKELGNKNFKDHDAGIELVDFEAGVALIAASKKPVFLMCGCPDTMSKKSRRLRRRAARRGRLAFNYHCSRKATIS